MELEDGLKMIVGAVRKKEMSLVNKRLLDDDIVKNAREKNFKPDFRESAEFRHSVYSGEGEKKFEELCVPARGLKGGERSECKGRVSW